MLRSLPQHAASIITQLCSGHVVLNTFLKKINAVNSALCKRCREPETLAHYLKHCKAYNESRQALKCEAGKAAQSIPRLLGDPHTIPHTLRFIQSSECFWDYLNIATKQPNS